MPHRANHSSRWRASPALGVAPGASREQPGWTMRVRPFVLGVLALALALPAGANASEIIGRNASDVKLQVNAKGQALVSYTSGGERSNVLVWGAVNAIAPTPGKEQVAFKVDYSGGWGT